MLTEFKHLAPPCLSQRYILVVLEMKTGFNFHWLYPSDCNILFMIIFNQVHIELSFVW